MNMHGFAILCIPIIGLVSICRDRTWNWRVIRSSTLLNGLFWTGWVFSLTVGILVLAGVK